MEMKEGKETFDDIQDHPAIILQITDDDFPVLARGSVGWCIHIRDVAVPACIYYRREGMHDGYINMSVSASHSMGVDSLRAVGSKSD
jgi:hypothetical protein